MTGHKIEIIVLAENKVRKASLLGEHGPPFRPTRMAGVCSSTRGEARCWVTMRVKGGLRCR
jgi:hypothetical protein